MSVCTLGIDTSNYTSSVALYDSSTDSVAMRKKLLPVRAGTLGLRQSDAVFAHLTQLGDLFAELFSEAGKPQITAIGVSTRPRSVEGSYMPCFMVGRFAAQMLASALRVASHAFSHQQGHIAAALYSAKRMALFSESFYALHLSGGTTELLEVTPDANALLSVRVISRSLDLKAGQAVDRVGRLLGLPFPAGPDLERLAEDCPDRISPKAVMKGADCCLSGIENQCQALLDRQYPPAYVAKFCLKSIEAAVVAMLDAATASHGARQIVCAGGVMSNRLIRATLAARFGDRISFAEPAFSADNAAGVAILAAKAQGE